MASKSVELRMTLLGVALLGLLLLSQHAAPVDAAESDGPRKEKTSFSMNVVGGRTLSSFSMNSAYSEKKPSSKGASATDPAHG
ncbi:uncharacterized protein LOC100275964 precursor [Zea mays]|jgi:hypothetical protein|nr:uncharacterized protein LOC100275964 precursor [Zea mays]ACG31160.1 hypothetical protein [Zea mays]|eukprot:NP_001338695.1 uncharacterized protein LOC100275964 precursor [Zea mays]